MEKKYYDLIISLIKEHKKYPGYEAILEDIANDVYEHSKVVIGSVTNEDVITSYINKVISTSIITVPKKMNYNVKARHRVITTLPIATTSPTEEIASINKTVDENDEKETFLEETTLEEIENPEVLTNESIISTQEEFLVTNTVEESEEFSEFELKQETNFNIEESTDLNEMFEEIDDLEEEENSDEYTISNKIEEIYSEEKIIEEDSIEEIDNIVEVPEEGNEADNEASAQPEVYDRTLVDKMINGTTSDKIEEIVTTDESIEDSLENSEIYDTLDEITPIEETYEEGLISEPIELNVEEAAIKESIEELNEDTVLNNTIEEVSLAIEKEEEEPAVFVIEENSSDEIFDLEEATSELEVFEDFESSTEELDLFENNNDDELINNTIDIDIKSTKNIEDEVTEDKDFNLPSFNVFDFEPELENYNTEEIIEILKDHQDKHPERKILEVCVLKYDKKLSIPEIANTIDMTEDEVLDVLSEIIDIVKD